jgi:hypothetical protein
MKVRELRIGIIAKARSIRPVRMLVTMTLEPRRGESARFFARLAQPEASECEAVRLGKLVMNGEPRRGDTDGLHVSFGRGNQGRRSGQIV